MSSKKNYFNIKNFLKVLFLIPILIIIIFAGTYFILAKVYDYKMYRLNHLNRSDLSNVYVNKEIGFSFNYPKNANVYNASNSIGIILRVFSDGNNRGDACDIYINDSQRYMPDKFDDTVQFNGLNWKKLREIDNTGSWMDRHFVSWYSQKNNNKVVMNSVIETEGYCEAIVSTFEFTK